MTQAYKVGSIDPNYTLLINKVSGIVHKISGNRLGEKQSYMIETRVKKRMSELGMSSAADYEKYINANLDSESMILVGLITTHHTYFFREFIHFEILKKELPALAKEVSKRADKTLRIWSAACSKGHEVYSLAMFLAHHLPKIDPTIDFKIFGTDIDYDSVKLAQNGVYNQNEIKEIPMVYLGNHWAHGTGDIAQFAKVKTVLKSKCEFKQGNLLKVEESVGNQKFDVIFCRNVFIYFEAEQVKKISMELMSKLHDHGIFFSGVSEPLSNFKLELDNLGPSAYTLKSASQNKSRQETTSSFDRFAISALPKEKKILRVMCVDDSSTIISLLKKILTKENGFEVVETAKNGLEAIEKLKAVSVDLMTLDIHMPEMDGITYLEKNFSAKHPPVMMISSASREDSDTAMRAFKFGASDYVEKPSLSNIEERGEEIRNKLMTLASLIDSDKKLNLSSYDQEKQVRYEIKDAQSKLRIMSGSLSHLSSFVEFFKESHGDQPPTVIAIEGAGELLEGITKENRYSFRFKVNHLDHLSENLEKNNIYFIDSQKHLDSLIAKYSEQAISVLIYGNCSNKSAKSFLMMKKGEIVLEDNGSEINAILKYKVKDVVPKTSFYYLSAKYLSN